MAEAGNVKVFFFFSVFFFHEQILSNFIPSDSARRESPIVQMCLSSHNNNTSRISKHFTTNYGPLYPSLRGPVSISDAQQRVEPSLDILFRAGWKLQLLPPSICKMC